MYLADIKFLLYFCIIFLIAICVGYLIFACKEYNDLLEKHCKSEERTELEQQMKSNKIIPLVSPLTDFELCYLQTLKYKNAKK